MTDTSVNYQAIVDDTIKKIESGALARGEILPGVTLLARHYGAGHTSVDRALRALDELGYVKSTPRGRIVQYGGPDRLWKLAEDALNALVDSGQAPRVDTTTGTITGQDGHLRLTDDGQWTADLATAEPQVSDVYQRVAQSLRQDIRDGRFATDQPLPGRRDLARRYRVADRTLEKAIQLLTGEGVLTSRADTRRVYIVDQNNKTP